MITKGTENYKKAQEIANRLTRMADTDRVKENSRWNIFDNELGMFIEKIKNLSGFVAEIANTVSKSMANPYRKGVVARISSKQAWCLACAAVENDIEF